jgi:hypothetical protein
MQYLPPRKTVLSCSLPVLFSAAPWKSLPFYARFNVVLVAKAIEEVRLAVQAMTSLAVSKVFF